MVVDRELKKSEKASKRNKREGKGGYMMLAGKERVVCGESRRGKGVCAGEETVPGAEEERRDYPGRFLGPTDRPRSDPGSDPLAMGKR